MTQIYVDMDGVLADFDSHHNKVFGLPSCKLIDNVDWIKVRAIPYFYRDIPPMPDMGELWNYVLPYKPIVLTGIPSSVEEAADNKKEWAKIHLGKDVKVICCKSSEKCFHAKEGDVLIDDWEKYKKLWVKQGGIWITHISARNSIDELKLRGF